MEREIFDLLRELQFTHWWFNGRRAVAAAWLADLRRRAPLTVLDIGSGPGALVPVLREFGTVDALEPDEPCHAGLSALGVRTVYAVADAGAWMPPQRYDLVTMFDVLEHVADDTALLGAVRERCAAAGGTVCFTAPAYRWLWGGLDDKAGHVRRYTAARARRILTAAGYRDIRVSYFMTLLFPLAVVSRLLRPRAAHDLAPVAPPLNRLLQAVFTREAPLLRCGLNLPFGLSVIARGRV